MERGHTRGHQNACGSLAQMERKPPRFLKIVWWVRRLKPRTDILGYSQPSLTGLVLALCLPRTASWATFSRTSRD